MRSDTSYAPHDVLGAVLLIGALFAFGLFNFKSDEPLVEAGLRAQSAAIAAGSVHGIDVQVEGRSLTVRGLADSAEEKAALLEALGALDGRGKMVAEIDILEPRAPFTLTATQDEALTAAGAVPTEAARAQLAPFLGESAERLELASGAPDADWADALATGLRALAQLERGTLEASDAQLSLTGDALTPQAAERVAVLLEALPEQYAATSTITALDDGTPLRVQASRRDGALEALSGKWPDVSEGRAPEGVTLSPLEMPFPDWDAAALAGLSALDSLQNGHLIVIGPTLSLSGEAWSQEAYDRVTEALDDMPAAMQVSSAITLADTGAAFGLVLEKTGTGITATGKVPQSLAPPVLEALMGVAPEAAGLEVARISPGQRWWDGARHAASAMVLLEEGRVSFDGQAILIEAVLTDPDARDALDAHLASLPDGMEVTRSLTLIDDGTPLRLTLRKTAEARSASGKWPSDLDAALLGDALGAVVTVQEAQTLPRADADWAGAARIGAKALALLREGEMTLLGDALTLAGTVQSPAEEEMVQTQLAGLPADVTVQIDLTYFDDGRPFAFKLVYDGASAVLSGKVPSDLGPASQSAILGVPVQEGALERAAITADADWWAAARQALRAVARLERGQVEMDAFSIAISGEVEDAGLGREIEARMGAIAGFVVEVEITAP